jgi:hypothetical protein
MKYDIAVRMDYSEIIFSITGCENIVVKVSVTEKRREGDVTEGICYNLWIG